MTTTLTLDKAGRVVIPKPLRDELQLGAGDSLTLALLALDHPIRAASCQ